MPRIIVVGSLICGNDLPIGLDVPSIKFLIIDTELGLVVDHHLRELGIKVGVETHVMTSA
jgi:hypothetical protein